MVKRYDFSAYESLDGLCVARDEVDDGNYTTHDDYAKLEAERDALQDEHARICLDWMSICGTQKKEIKELTAERDALRGALEAILNDCESVLEQFYPESIALARTALGGW